MAEDANLTGLGSAPLPASASTSGPCTPWITAADVEALTACSDVDPEDPMLEVASGVLYELSGQRFAGACSTMVNPGVYCACANDQIGLGPGIGCCPGTRHLVLGALPVTEVLEVRLDGEVVSPFEYRLHGQRLYRLPDGNNVRQVWPCCRRPDSVPDERIEVDFTYGEAPPRAGVLAAATLACELLRATGETEGECRLPQRVQTITRQGITMAMLDPMAFLDNGRTGIYEVDLFLASYVESAGKRSSGIVNPDTVRASRA
jgi:hypothetical protein